MCLARSIALSNSSTVLVDCDIRRRAVSEALLPAEWDGLGVLLAGSATLDEALFQDARTPLKILGTNKPPAHGNALFSEAQLEKLSAELKGRFDVVIFDTAPVLGIAETRAIAAAADRVLLLGRWRMTSIKAVDTAIDLLTSSGAKLTGMVLTVVDVRKYASTGQEDVYSYHSKFAGYYAD
jgi:Mrp family chromosome partitioning ATPase